jgi:hypothetical protein
MKKSKTHGGDPAYGISLKVIFTHTDFTKALGEEQYKTGRLDFETLKKKEAYNILKHRLQWNGRLGEYQGLDLGSDMIEEYNECWEKASEWVSKNYPYLIKL